jgi:serine/threonine-protein kinase
LFVLGELARALDAAHAAELVHRDLKPGNVFLERDGERVNVKVLDFGIARSLDSAHATVTEAGTPAYAAPEQTGAILRRRAAKDGLAVAAEVSPATDVWALGLIAYECLSGAPPMQVWGVETSTELPMRMLEAPPVPSQVAGAGTRWLPAGFDGWFARCVDRDAGQRFQGAGGRSRRLQGSSAGARSQSRCGDLVDLRDAVKAWADARGAGRGKRSRHRTVPSKTAERAAAAPAHGGQGP